MAALNLLSLVVLGAAGGHNYNWQQKRKERFQSAQMYHMVASFGMFMGRFASEYWVRLLIGSSFLAGTALFCAPLYYMVFKDDENFALKRFMPVGGISMMIGFAAFALL